MNTLMKKLLTVSLIALSTISIEARPAAARVRKPVAPVKAIVPKSTKEEDPTSVTPPVVPMTKEEAKAAEAKRTKEKNAWISGFMVSAISFDMISRNSTWCTAHPVYTAVGLAGVASAWHYANNRDQDWTWDGFVKAREAAGWGKENTLSGAVLNVGKSVASLVSAVASIDSNRVSGWVCEHPVETLGLVYFGYRWLPSSTPTVKTPTIPTGMSVASKAALSR